MSEEADYTLPEIKRLAPDIIALVQATFQAASEKLNLPEPKLVPVEEIEAGDSGLSNKDGTVEQDDSDRTLHIYTIATVDAGSLRNPGWSACKLQIMGREKTGLTFIDENGRHGDPIMLDLQDFPYQCARAVARLAHPAPIAPK